MNKHFNNLDTYVLVHWPESQIIMDSPRIDDCVLNFDEDAAYFVPYDLYMDLYMELRGKK